MPKIKDITSIFSSSKISSNFKTERIAIKIIPKVMGVHILVIFTFIMCEV